MFVSILRPNLVSVQKATTTTTTTEDSTEINHGSSNPFTFNITPPAVHSVKKKERLNSLERKRFFFLNE